MFDLTAKHLRTVHALDGVMRVPFTYDVEGRLVGITDIDSLTTTFERDESGNLNAVTNPFDQRTSFTTNAAGGFKAISRKDTTNAVEYTVATADGKVSKYLVERLPNGDTRLTNTDASGLKTITVHGTDGTTTITTPDGTVITRTDGPDPRFGMQALLESAAKVLFGIR